MIGYNFIHDIQDIIKNDIPVHFVNFEYYARTMKITYPIELGICTYKMSEFKLLGEFHQLIYCDINEFVDKKKIKNHHGLDTTSSFLRNDYKNIVNELTKYLKSFNDKICCIVKRKETRNPSYECFVKLFQLANEQFKNFEFIKESEFLYLLCSFYNKSIESPYSLLMSVSTRIGSIEKCQIHKEIMSKGCALDSVKLSANSIFVIMKNMKIPFKEIDQLPILLFVNKNYEKEQFVSSPHYSKSKEEIIKERAERKEQKKLKQESKIIKKEEHYEQQFIKEKKDFIIKANEKQIENEENEFKQNKFKLIALNLFKEINIFEFPIHFFDFEFSSSKTDGVIPLELGISTYYLNESKEINFYHTLIKPSHYNSSFERAVGVHGIDLHMNYTQSYSEIINGLTNYLNSFKGKKLLVLKDETIGGDVLCFNNLFGYIQQSIPNDYIFTTHHFLLEYIATMKGFDNNKAKEYGILMNDVYKQLKISNRCPYHQLLADRYHCGLQDARHTALATLLILRDIGYKIKNNDKLPFCVIHKNTDFSFNKNRFVFVDTSATDDRKIIELCLSSIKINNQNELIVDKQYFTHFNFSNKIQTKEEEPKEIINTLNSFLSQDPQTVIVPISFNSPKIIEFLSYRQFPLLAFTDFMSLFVKHFNPKKKSTGLLSKAKKQCSKYLHVLQCPSHPKELDNCCFVTSTNILFSLQYLTTHLN
ncbi:hypothetical protein EDI_103980 [Entamoeba dispar SAW760]|uniref:Uncharacterized protein n=1 Tax=Entamoeba dispar (strain ATCC PRA-260 / SAW760) TaxID=370354 RepID=B0ELX6_ENTDS|nr:uncharacterized protein EDI_103980 [Entamoeba dispar SAW760]EDR24481.1 hypothetical protein EDI_103980 [Entamoeba dispar SAW760]|eukprot:EDR24481.1 hypothetical protein EDI_103980 [Entamoeba dispar SAW760]